VVDSHVQAPGRVPGAANLDHFRSILIAAAATLTAAVAGLAFWVSFEAISAYVVRIGAFPANLRYAGPLLVDSFTVLATVFLLWLALAGTPLRKVWDAYYAWALIITATAASAYLNAAHVAPGAPDVARVVAGAVPVTLLGAVHLLVLLLLRLLAGRPQVRPDWPMPVPETPAPEEASPTAIPPGSVEPDPDQDRGPGGYRSRVAQDTARRPGPATRGGPRNGTLTKADMQALDRAGKNPAGVERIVAKRGLDRSLVAARPERWPLPSRNGTPHE
jgi:hypothetical protein